jgi:drug/metabolite transporter (DMT)-like permease
MSPLAISLWIANIAIDTTGHLALKSAAITDDDLGMQRWRTMLSSPMLWMGIGCFCIEFVVWFALLSLIPLSQAMLIGSINIVVVMLAGRVFFGERLDGMRIAGMTFIATGVALAGSVA